MSCGQAYNPVVHLAVVGVTQDCCYGAWQASSLHEFGISNQRTQLAAHVFCPTILLLHHAFAEVQLVTSMWGEPLNLNEAFLTARLLTSCRVAQTRRCSAPHVLRQ